MTENNDDIIQKTKTEQMKKLKINKCGLNHWRKNLNPASLYQ